VHQLFIPLTVTRVMKIIKQYLPLSGLSNTKKLKYETAIQLYNLEQDNGKHFTLEDIGKKFFTINEKIARGQALTHLALGSAARSQYDHDHKRGNGRWYGAG
jgi:hypothetical protein